LDATDAAERHAPIDPDMWDAIGTVRSYANDQQRALAAYDRAVALAPKNPQYSYNRAFVRRFLGDLGGAEADYDRVIAMKPLDYEAYLNRSELRVQTAARNHVTQLEALAGQEIADWRGAAQIRFALAKEYEVLVHLRSHVIAPSQTRLPSRSPLHFASILVMSQSVPRLVRWLSGSPCSG
jgi:tetratricopeptide (TPR) repeat protein